MYEINSNTLVIEPTNSNESKVCEIFNDYSIKDSVKNIINNSCRYYGSSYEGRLSGTKKIIGISYKAPIIIEESDEIVFFPTSSPRFEHCIWISLKNILNYEKNGKRTIVTFSNKKKIDLDISYISFDNQVLRAARLQMLLKNRKIKQNS